MTALVTGANGFVGSAIVRALATRGDAVVALVRGDSDLTNLRNLPVDTRVGDLRDPGSLRSAVSGCETVFHAAADYRLWVPDPAPMYAANIDGTRHIIEAAVHAGARRIVYTSSVAALGATADDQATDEDTSADEAEMIGHYKRSKYLAEREASRLASEKGAPVVIVNPSTPLGPGDIKPTPTGRIILDAMLGRIPAFVDTGLNIVHVDDVALGHIAALEYGRPGRRYILGGEDLTLRDILTHVANAVGRRPPSVTIPHGAAMLIARVAETVAGITGKEPRATVDGVRMSRKKMFYSSNRAVNELGYRSRPATDAIDDAIAWFSQRSEGNE